MCVCSLWISYLCVYTWLWGQAAYLIKQRFAGACSISRWWAGSSADARCLSLSWALCHTGGQLIRTRTTVIFYVATCNHMYERWRCCDLICDANGTDLWKFRGFSTLIPVLCFQRHHCGLSSTTVFQSLSACPIFLHPSSVTHSQTHSEAPATTFLFCYLELHFFFVSYFIYLFIGWLKNVPFALVPHPVLVFLFNYFLGSFICKKKSLLWLTDRAGV